MSLLQELYLDNLDEANLFSNIKSKLSAVWNRLKNFIKSKLARLGFGQTISIPLRIPFISESGDRTPHILNEFYTALFLIEKMESVGYSIKNANRSKQIFQQKIKELKEKINARSEDRWTRAKDSFLPNPRDIQAAHSSGKIGATELFNSLIESNDSAACIFEVVHSGGNVVIGQPEDITINVYKKSEEQIIKQIGVSLKHYEGKRINYSSGSNNTMLKNFFANLKNLQFIDPRRGKRPQNDKEKEEKYQNIRNENKKIISRNFGSEWGERYYKEYSDVNIWQSEEKGGNASIPSKFLADFLTAQYNNHKEEMNNSFAKLIGIEKRNQNPNEPTFIEVSYMSFIGRSTVKDPRIIRTLNSAISENYKKLVKEYLNKNVNLTFINEAGTNKVKIQGNVNGQMLGVFEVDLAATMRNSNISTEPKLYFGVSNQSDENGNPVDLRSDEIHTTDSENQEKYGISTDNYSYKDKVPVRAQTAPRGRPRAQPRAQTTPTIDTTEIEKRIENHLENEKFTKKDLNKYRKTLGLDANANTVYKSLAKKAQENIDQGDSFEDAIDRALDTELKLENKLAPNKIDPNSDISKIDPNKLEDAKEYIDDIKNQIKDESDIDNYVKDVADYSELDNEDARKVLKHMLLQKNESMTFIGFLIND
jgi:hypothetical protein